MGGWGTLGGEFPVGVEGGPGVEGVFVGDLPTFCGYSTLFPLSINRTKLFCESCLLTKMDSAQRIYQPINPMIVPTLSQSVENVNATFA